MISLQVIILILSLHFIADFIFQTDWMAINKSKSLWPLSAHILVYATIISTLGIKFGLINGVAHWITDFFTSRATSCLWKKEKRHWFFVVIGLDQLIHAITLFSVWHLLRR